MGFMEPIPVYNCILDGLLPCEIWQVPLTTNHPGLQGSDCPLARDLDEAGPLQRLAALRKEKEVSGRQVQYPCCLPLCSREVPAHKQT